jgi:hypothetical protein
MRANNSGKQFVHQVSPSVRLKLLSDLADWARLMPYRSMGCKVWVGSQVIAQAQTAAKTAGLPLDRVVVHGLRPARICAGKDRSPIQIGPGRCR